MGLCNLKWTAEEEASLKDAVLKHGPGKWADILKDPQFRSVLRARSNVDLKDKWRNMQSAMNGESPNSCSTVQKNAKMTSKRFDKSVALINEVCDEDKIAEPEPPSSVNEASQEGGSEKLTRFDDFKLEDLVNVKQPSEIDCSTQIQQGRDYHSACPNSRWAEIDAELMMIAQMSPEDAAAAATAAVKTAEAAIAEAEEAEKEAEEAENAADEAKSFYEQLTKELREKKARPATSASATPKRGKPRRSQR